MKKDKEKEEVTLDAENTTEKSFWIVGFGWIIFLILLIGSIVGLAMTRGGINNILGKVDDIDGNGNKENFIILEDGSKENVNEDITTAEFTIDGRKFHSFKIVEKEGISSVEAKIENVTENILPEASFKIRIYGENDELIKEYMIITTEIKPKASTLTATNIIEECANAVKVEVEMVGVSQELKSGE